jgi:1,4-alpha-glucan branching enzyme
MSSQVAQIATHQYIYLRPKESAGNKSVTSLDRPPGIRYSFAMDTKLNQRGRRKPDPNSRRQRGVKRIVTIFSQPELDAVEAAAKREGFATVAKWVLNSALRAAGYRDESL